MARTLVPVTDITPPKASLTTALAGANNDLVFTAKKGGTWGNSIQVEYIDPGGTTATLSVVVSGFLITVNLARVASAISTIASDISTAIAASRDASDMVTVANSGADTGAGLVIALSATNLSGGSYGTVLPAVTNGDATNDHYFTGNDGRVVLQVVSSDAGAQNVTIHYGARAVPGLTTTPEVRSIAAGVTVELGPFPIAQFNQNAAGDVYFDPAVSNTLDFRAYRVTQV